MSRTKERYSVGYANRAYKIFKEKEVLFRMPLKVCKFYIIRFDGKGMTKGFKIKHKAINELFFNTMKLAFINFAKKYPKIIFAYSFSDEISLLFKVRKNDSEEFLRGEKLLSLMSGQLALEFLKATQATSLDCMGKDWLFDARLIELEKNEVIDYFKSRQAYAIDKYLSQCKGEYALDYRLVTSSEIIDALKEKDIDYDKMPQEYKYGLMYGKNSILDSFEIFGDEEKLQELCFGKISETNKAA